MTEAEILAARIEVDPLGWLPIVGDCINVTFTPEEARLLVSCLRATPHAPVPAQKPGDPLAGLVERLDRLCLTSTEDGRRFVLATESARNIVGIVREWIRSRSTAKTVNAQTLADAARYQHLKTCCSYHYPESHNPPSPREFGIEWHWQDGAPERPDIDTLIDRQIEEKRVLHTADEDEGQSVLSTQRSSPAATIGDIPSEPRPPASAAMGLSAGGERRLQEMWRLPQGVVCKCPKMQTGPDGGHWCCTPPTKSGGAS